MTKAASTEDSAKHRELTIAADESQLSRVRDFIVEACDEAAFSGRETSNTKLAVDEACTNIIKHAYGGPEKGEILIRVDIEPGGLSISLRDTGKRFDFASIEDPDLDQYVETGRKGGLGVFLINRLMDGVEYHASDSGNELVLVKRSQSAVSRGLIDITRPFRGTLKYKFTMRASTGFLVLVGVIWAVLFMRQSSDIEAQRTGQWMEKRRVAESLANRSKDLLLTQEEFSVEQTNLSAYLSKMLENNDDLAYMRVVNAKGEIASSGNIDEIFTEYSEPPGTILLNEKNVVVWKEVDVAGRRARDIRFTVQVTNSQTGQKLSLGHVHLGVYEDAVNSAVEDPRIMTAIILLGIFLVGILLIFGLVSVFVKPIQVLTDGVRAIGDGNLDGKLDIGGPAEIGAIAGVFNEITDKFKKAQNSILEQEKLQKEMEVAKQIQQSLLPRKKPTVSGYDIAPLYQAAAEVGGDYYDFVQVDDETIGVVVADVSGKGVPGSLVMTMIRTALRMEARGNKNASDVMSKMNEFVTDDMKKGMFVTMFYVIVDSKNRTISYASAGHNPMILYRHETNETFFLNPKGFPVGISLPDEALFRKSISLEKVKLKKDDMLLIYTDGVTEAMNEKRDQYGEDRLIAFIKENGHLPPEDFINNLDRDIKKFTAGHPQNDDITVVAIKEKLAADDVLFGIRKKLLDLVEVEGLSVKDACKQMRVSPATYYRYKKRMEVMGERGLRDKVLRQDVTLKRVSLEARVEILDIIRDHPEFGAKRITEEYNANKDEIHQISERMVYDELKRLNLNTRDLRVDYLKRSGLIEQEGGRVDRKTGRQIVDDFLKEISGVELPLDEKRDVIKEIDEDAEPAEPAAPGPGAPGRLSASAFELIDGVGLTVSDSGDGVTTVIVNGHLDSVTSATLEQRLKALIADRRFKIIVDLTEVTYISSGGWGIFTGEVRHLRENGGDVVLVGMTSEVYDVYELLGFEELLKAFPLQADALEYFKLSPEERYAIPSASGEETSISIESEIGAEELGEGYVPEWEGLRIEAATVGEVGDIAVLSVRGIIDTVSAENLRSALDKIISGGINKVVVDMSQVEYVSSGGWGAFTERLREVRRNDGDIKLFGMDPDVYYVFTMLGFNIVLSSFDILVEAIEDFDRGATRRQAIEPEPAGTEPELTRPPATTPRDRKQERIVADAAPDIDFSRRARGDVVEWEHAGHGIFVAHLTGLIEATAVGLLERSLMDTIAAKPPCVVFDLGGVEYMSSMGWGQIAKCYELSKDWGGVVAICGMSAELYDIFSCLEFKAFIRAYATLEEAVRVLSKRSKKPGGAPPAERAVFDDSPDDVLQEIEPAGEPGPEIRPEDDIDDEILSVDNVLDDAPAERDADRPWDKSEPSTFEIIAGDDVPVEEQRPADHPRKPAGVEGADEAPDAPAEPEQPEVSGEPKIADISGRGFGVDVDLAVTDKNVDKDEELRRLGWAKYGERLKKKAAQNKKKNED